MIPIQYNSFAINLLNVFSWLGGHWDDLSVGIDEKHEHVSLLPVFCPILLICNWPRKFRIRTPDIRPACTYLPTTLARSDLESLDFGGDASRCDSRTWNMHARQPSLNWK